MNLIYGTELNRTAIIAMAIAVCSVHVALASDAGHVPYVPAVDKCEIATPVPAPCKTLLAEAEPTIAASTLGTEFTDANLAAKLSEFAQNQNVSAKFAPPGPP